MKRSVSQTDLTTWILIPKKRNIAPKKKSRLLFDPCNRSEIPLLNDIWKLIFRFLPVGDWRNTRKSCFLFNQIFKESIDPTLIENKECVKYFGRYIDRVKMGWDCFDIDYFLENKHFPIIRFCPKITELIVHTRKYGILTKLIDNGIFFHDEGQLLGNVLLHLIVRMQTNFDHIIHDKLKHILTSDKIHHGIFTIKYRQDLITAAFRAESCSEACSDPSPDVFRWILHKGRTIMSLSLYESMLRDIATRPIAEDDLSTWKREREALFKEGLISSVFRGTK